MSLTDSELIEKYKVKPTDKILDIGGSMKQHKELKIDTLVDIIRPEEAPYGPSKLRAKKFVNVDIVSQKLPFADKEFDFCLCTHNLEDLPYPFLAIEEMSRVARKGLIVTPSMGEDIVFTNIDFTNWATGARRVPGLGHHKWLFYEEGGKMIVLPKNYPLLYSSQFHFTRWLGEEELEYYWEGNINYTEVNDLDFHQLIGEYKKFAKKNSNKLRRGLVLFYLDNPLMVIRAWLKLLLRRGKGFHSKIK